MYKSIITTVLIFMGLAAQAQNVHVIDSLRGGLNKAVTDTGRIHGLMDVAGYYSNELYVKTSSDTADLYLREAQKLYKKQYGVAIQHQISLLHAVLNCLRNPDRDLTAQFLPILADCRKTGDKANEMDAWFELAFNSDANDKSNPYRLSCLQHAFSLAHELHDRLEMTYLWHIANTHVQMHKYDLAESELFQILKNPKTDPDVVLQSNNLLAHIYTSTAEYDKAALYVMKTVRIMEVTKDSTYASAYYGQLAYLHYVLKNYPLSLYWAKKWLNNDMVTNRPLTIYNAGGYVVNCLLNEKRPNEALKFILGIQAKYKAVNGNDRHLLAKNLGACYDALNENALAEKYYLEMISIDPGGILQGNRYASDKAENFSTIGIFYIKTGQFKKAKMYSLQALKYDKITGVVSSLQSTNLSLFKADSALGNYRSAITDLQESNRLKDSMFTIAKNKQIEEVNISYQTEEREKDLKLVQNRANLEQVQLQHTETTRNWIIAGSGLLLIIAGLLYRQSRLRRKSNELITNKNEVITHKNELLQSLVEEKEWLLKEVHHRVKNNLHTVICLLESQAAYLQNDALEAIEKSQHRIYTMSLIHQKLYQSDDVKMIDMAVYIPELVKYLSDSFGVSNRVYFNLAIEPINLNPAQAIPLALLINEALTNSIKYAFPNDRRGEITISLTDTEDQYKLVLADNGVGLPQKEQKAADSLGMDLMKGLAKEIRGSIYIENNNGVKITVIFEHDALNDVDILEADYFTSQPGEA